jgi:hypothetical protein
MPVREQQKNRLNRLFSCLADYFVVKLAFFEAKTRFV